MPARRKLPKKPDRSAQLDAIATSGLTEAEREAVLPEGKALNRLIKDHPDWEKALRKGAAAVDALALKQLFQLVSGDVEVVEERYAIRDEAGNVIGTRKITRPGPSFQALKYWLELRAGNGATAQSSAATATIGVPTAESKERVMSSILALIKPKDDPVIEDAVPRSDY
jgi:hypothetical protein